MQKANKRNKMDKVKIKRVNRKKKKATTAEKILAGVGLTSTIFGGGGAGASGGAEPTTAMVSHSNNEHSGIKEKLKDIFGIKQAKADYTEGSIPASQVTQLTGGYVPPAVVYGGNLYQQNGENYEQTASGSQVTSLIQSGGLTAGTIIVVKKVGFNDLLSGKWIGRVIPKSNGGTFIASPSGAVQGQANVISNSHGAFAIEDVQYLMENQPDLASAFELKFDLEQTQVVDPQGQSASLGDVIRQSPNINEMAFTSEMITMATGLASSAALSGLLTSAGTASATGSASIIIHFANNLGSIFVPSAAQGAATQAFVNSTNALAASSMGPGAVVPTAGSTGFFGSINNAVSGGLKSVSAAMKTASQAVSKFFGLGSNAAAGATIIGVAITGAITGIMHWRSVARNNMLKVADTQAINAVNPQIFEIVNIYNSNAGRTLEEETELYREASTAVVEIYSEAAAKFQRQASITSQNQYIQGFLDGMAQTYEQRKQAHLNELANLEIFEQPDGTRGAYTSVWGMIVLKGDGNALYIERTNADMPPPESFLITILGKNNVRSVPDIDYPGKVRAPVDPIAPITTNYEVYLTDNGKVVYVGDYGGVLTIKPDGSVLNEAGQAVSLPQEVYQAILNSPVIDIRVNPGAVPPDSGQGQTPPPVANAVIYDVYLMNEGKGAWADGFGFIIIKADRTVINQAGGVVNGVPNSVIEGILASTRVTDVRTAPPLPTAPVVLTISNTVPREIWRDSAGVSAAYIEEVGTKVYRLPSGLLLLKHLDGSFVEMTTYNYSQEVLNRVRSILSVTASTSVLTLRTTPVNLYTELPIFYSPSYGVASNPSQPSPTPPAPTYTLPAGFVMPPGGFAPGTALPNGLVAGNTGAAVNPNTSNVSVSQSSQASASELWQQVLNAQKAGTLSQQAPTVNTAPVAMAPVVTSGHTEIVTPPGTSLSQALRARNTLQEFGIATRDAEYILSEFPKSASWARFTEWANSSRNTQFTISGTNSQTGENFNAVINKTQASNILAFLRA